MVPKPWKSFKLILCPAKFLRLLGLMHLSSCSLTAKEYNAAIAGRACLSLCWLNSVIHLRAVLYSIVIKPFLLRRLLRQVYHAARVISKQRKITANPVWLQALPSLGFKESFKK